MVEAEFERVLDCPSAGQREPDDAGCWSSPVPGTTDWARQGILLHGFLGEVFPDLIGRDHVAREEVERAVVLELHGDLPHHG